MADLINKQDVLNEIVRFSIEEGSSVECQQLYCDVNNMPAYKEPKTGYWEQYGDPWEDKFKCSECGKKQPKILCGEQIIGHWSDFCPNCGAKMESEEEA